MEEEDTDITLVKKHQNQYQTHPTYSFVKHGGY